jgi:hypothetical protein
MIDGTYGFVYCSTEGLGIGVFTVRGEHFLGVDATLHLLFRRTKPLPHHVARFRQVNMDNPCTNHDALEFPDGQIAVRSILCKTSSR